MNAAQSTHFNSHIKVTNCLYHPTEQKKCITDQIVSSRSVLSRSAPGVDSMKVIFCTIPSPDPALLVAMSKSYGVGMLPHPVTPRSPPGSFLLPVICMGKQKEVEVPILQWFAVAKTCAWLLMRSQDDIKAVWCMHVQASGSYFCVSGQNDTYLAIVDNPFWCCCWKGAAWQSLRHQGGGDVGDDKARRHGAEHVFDGNAQQLHRNTKHLND